MTHQARGRTDPDFLYFAYGSNLDAERLRLRCPSAHFRTIARLPDHSLVFSRHSERWRGGVADLRAVAGEEVWGATWVVQGAESHALDEQEGLFRDPPSYRRYDVAVETPSGDTLSCRTYQVVSPAAHDIPPSPRYRETMLRGARVCALPEDYIERIAALPDNGRLDGGPI